MTHTYFHYNLSGQAVECGLCAFPMQFTQVLLHYTVEVLFCQLNLKLVGRSTFPYEIFELITFTK